MAERIGEILLKRKLVNSEQLESALQEQSYTGEFLGEILIRLGYTQEDSLLKVLAEQFSTRFVTLGEIHINPIMIKLVPKSLVWEYEFFPVELRAGVLLIAVSNPLDMWPMSVVREKLNLNEVQIVLAGKKDILKTIEQHYGAKNA